MRYKIWNIHVPEAPCCECSELWRRVVWGTNISYENTATIFTVQVKIKTVHSSKKLGPKYESTRRHNPEDVKLWQTLQCWTVISLCCHHILLRPPFCLALHSQMKRRRRYTEMSGLAVRSVANNTGEIEHALLRLTEDDFRPVLAWDIGKRWLPWKSSSGWW
jgi:hypothetical protein